MSRTTSAARVPTTSPLLFVCCAEPLNYVGSVAIAGLVVDAVNFAIQPGPSKAGRHLLDFSVIQKTGPLLPITPVG